MNSPMKIKKGFLYKTGFLILFLCIALSFYFYKKNNIKTDSTSIKTNSTTPTKIPVTANESNKTTTPKSTSVKENETVKKPDKNVAPKSTTAKENETKTETAKEPSKKVTPTNTKVEENRKDLEDLIFNYIDIYKTLINNKDSDITYINDIVAKNSNFETNIKNEIKDYRTKYSKIEDFSFKIKSIESINNTNEYSIIVEEQVNYLLPEGTSQKLTNNYKYSVVFDKQQSGIMKREVVSTK